jgi:Tol biopolymer transport system component
VLRYPRLSPDRAWVLYQSWERTTRSWDLRAVERASGREVAVTSDPANEVEASWLPDGRTIVFASDRRRGLASAALYRVSFAP